MEPQWDGGTKICSRGLGHMTKMAATPIYGKNPSKIGSIIVCSNDDPRLTLTYLKARSNLVSCFYMGKTVRTSFNGRSLQQMTRVTKGLCLYKNSDPKGLSASSPGLYTCIKNMKTYV